MSNSQNDIKVSMVDLKISYIYTPTIDEEIPGFITKPYPKEESIKNANRQKTKMISDLIADLLDSIRLEIYDEFDNKMYPKRNLSYQEKMDALNSAQKFLKLNIGINEPEVKKEDIKLYKVIKQYDDKDSNEIYHCVILNKDEDLDLRKKMDYLQINKSINSYKMIELDIGMIKDITKLEGLNLTNLKRLLDNM